MTRRISDFQRRVLLSRAAARGMTVEQYLVVTELEYEDANQRYRLMSDHGLQMACIAQFAARHGRTFSRWSVS